ncbi:hypothetical protein, partial [Stenotrophomonas sp. HMWF003]|uniref:hypothetical protein n=1 Tax=Stenotrophomonas sp. HMWF003 TaxID=2056840 RepID=UPI001C628AA5
VGEAANVGDHVYRKAAEGSTGHIWAPAEPLARPWAVAAGAAGQDGEMRTPKKWFFSTDGVKKHLATRSGGQRA